MRTVAWHVSGDDAVLSAELVLPSNFETPSPAPAMVLFHGASEGTRDYLRPQADAFAAAGIAAVLFDRRGEGDSTGERNMNLFLLANDGVALVEEVRRRPEVDEQRVGLWGYSNGAWVAGLVASRVVPACLVLTGASAVSPAASEVFRRTIDLRGRDVPPGTVRAVERAWTIVFGVLAGSKLELGWEDELHALVTTIEEDEAITSLPPSRLAVENPELDSVPRRQVLEGLRERFGALPDFEYDPMPVLRSLLCPILTVLAEQDANLPMAESLPRFQALAASRSPLPTRIDVVPGASHRFTTPDYDATHPFDANHGPREANDYLPGYLEGMAEWASQTLC